jgi:methylmalonyl-CoA mutase
MSLENMMNEKFTTTSLEDWKKKAEESLKGRPIETLSRNTYENIQLKPLYSSADQQEGELSQFPGELDFRRGTESLGYLKDSWKIAQKVNYKNEEDLISSLGHALEKGQNAISFEYIKENLDNLSIVLTEVYEKAPFSIDAKSDQTILLEELEKLSNREKVSGYIGMDPIALLTRNGKLPEELDNFYDAWALLIQDADRNLPNLKTVLIDSTPYLEAGANSTQELGISLAVAVFHIEELMKRGITLQTILSKLVFKYSIGANFFMEIAKLRAARFLWSKVTEAYGADLDHQKMTISAETSSFTKTAFDPYVNILRSGNEAFAAIIGGVQYLHVQAFDELSGETSPLSERLARNTQLILKEEALLKKVMDPAVGSWYVEHLKN